MRQGSGKELAGRFPDQSSFSEELSPSEDFSSEDFSSEKRGPPGAAFLRCSLAFFSRAFSALTACAWAFSARRRASASVWCCRCARRRKSEALLVRRGHEVQSFFNQLRFVVVDELHVFIGTERGRQLQSLMHRVDLAARRSCPRIALSATLGDMDAAADFLRPGHGAEVVQIVSDEAQVELKLQLRGYVRRPPGLRAGSDDRKTQSAAEEHGDDHDIAGDLFIHLRGRDNLIFANARARVEHFADLLRRRSRQERVPNEFFPHHGNLSKALREQLEEALKKERPVSAVCTSTLELGIDIGSVHSIAQIGPPPGVASLRQRLGRSGRRAGEAAILRLYLSEEALDGQNSTPDALRLRLVQTIAMVNLLLKRWYEPPVMGALHLSTLIQQLLSLIAQHGGAHADQAYEALCKYGPFRETDPPTFATLLRDLGGKDILVQSRDGTLLLGEQGERIVGHYTFYAAFQTGEEYRLVHGGNTLGTLPISHAVTPGLYLVFGGRRWRITEVSSRSKRIAVEPSHAGRPPTFGGGAGLLDDRILLEMLRVYLGEDVPVYLDPVAEQLLEEARLQFKELGLAESWLVADGRRTFLFPWLGTRALNGLALALLGSGVEMGLHCHYLSVEAPLEDTMSLLHQLCSQRPPEASTLARRAENKESEKYHGLCSEELMCREYGAAHLNMNTCWQRLSQIESGTKPENLPHEET